MKHFKIIVSVFLVLLLISAFCTTAWAAPVENEKTIKILFTHDMHSAFLPNNLTDASGKQTELGGFARLYTAIKSEKAYNPQGTLLLDGGDYSMGTIFQSLYLSDAAELKIMGKMGYDAVTAGNHEFDFTLYGFGKSLQNAGTSGEQLPTFVQSNMKFPQKNEVTNSVEQAMQKTGVKEYTVLERKGFKIGIFGLMGDEAASFAPMAKPAVFEDIIETSKRIVAKLREEEKADLVICLSHSGTKENKQDSEDENLAEKVPGIDVIISSHTHTTYTSPVIAGGAIIVSCGANAENLGMLEIIPCADGKWQVNDYKLQPIDASIEADKAIASEVEKYKQLVQDKLLTPEGFLFDEPVVFSPYLFDEEEVMFDNPGEYTLGNLVADSFIDAVQKAEGKNYETVDAAVVPMGTIRSTIYPGNLSAADIFKIMSLGTGPDGKAGYPLISVYLTGSELINVCEVDASIAPMMGDAQLHVSGIKYAYGKNRLIFNKVVDAVMVLPDGSMQNIDDKKTYRVVCGLYTGQMLGVVKSKSFGILSITPKDKNGNEIKDLDNQIIYADKNGQKAEIKEWQALTSFLMSFPKENGLSVIPQKYAAAEGRKSVQTSQGIFGFFSHLNTFAMIVYAIILVIVVLLAFIIIKIIKCIKKRKLKAAA